MESNPKIFALKWYRLSVKLVNIRKLTSTSSHPFSIIQAIVKSITSSFYENNQISQSHIFFHIKGKRHTFKIKQGDIIPLEIFFCKRSLEYVNEWKERLKNYLEDPETGKNYHIVEISQLEERYFEKVLNDIGKIKTEGEIFCEFLSPFPFKPEKYKHRTYISTENFIHSFEKRFSRLFGEEIVYKSNKDNFSVLPYYWQYTEIKHLSKSQPGSVQYINGCIGKLYIKGKFGDFLPFLILGSELHTGTKISNSQGYYILNFNPTGYFERFFPDKRAIVSVIKEVLERYDNAFVSLEKEEKFHFNESEFAEKIYNEIKGNSYLPTPNTAFFIKKKDKGERIVEQLSFKDLIVQQYLLKTISKPFDRMFEECSIGFRKGMSREKAIEMIRNIISEGYQYVIETDIEDFFPSVELNILIEKLDFYLPESDLCLKNLLVKCIKAGYVLNGKYYERIKGLAQGSPLSPILANFYLDWFDEELEKLNCKMIRYGDDIVIFTRTKEDAEKLLSQTKEILAQIGLRVKKEKTGIKPIEEGFNFLGINFTSSEAVVLPEQEFKKMKKPLYITEPHIFLSLNGDAVDIKKQGTIIGTIPLRRISEIICMERCAFSTSFVRKCTENEIPITITLNSGYYITTIKPDSKKYYEINYYHTQKYFSLTEAEYLCITKEFAAGKIKNYISLLKQRYIKGQNIFIKALEDIINQIYEAGDIDKIRGLEGSAAKKIYKILNLFIENEKFHIKSREKRKPDMINSLLNFGYYLLFSRINATIRAVGLNPYLGFLHSPENNYESFAYDILELFRARIDRLIIKLINLKVITEKDFLETENRMYLKHEAVKKFINQFEGELDRKDSKKDLSLSESIYLQIIIFKNWVIKDNTISFYNWIV
ncbi:MAG: CRISPR-associated endonuclease Cas1 [Candidatus Omnitrophica bacterium]|nr:CRISPR-associated endonuclease Cas1 [Candidatus Omnitrophota bacterium]